MHGVRYNAQTGVIALAAAQARVLVMVKPATNQRLIVRNWGIWFDGVDSTATPVLVELVRFTGDGTMTGLTVRKLNTADDEAPTVTATHSSTGTLPTDGGDIPFAQYVHPQTGHLWAAPLGDEIVVPTGGRLGIRATAADAVNAIARISCVAG